MDCDTRVRSDNTQYITTSRNTCEEIEKINEGNLLYDIHYDDPVVHSLGTIGSMGNTSNSVKYKMFVNTL